MARPAVNIKDLPPDIQKRVRKTVGIPKARRFTAEQERRHALLILAAIADLTQAERARVLVRAKRINEV